MILEKRTLKYSWLIKYSQMRVLTSFEDSLKSKRNEKSFQQFLLSKESFIHRNFSEYNQICHGRATGRALDEVSWHFKNCSIYNLKLNLSPKNIYSNYSLKSTKSNPLLARMKLSIFHKLISMMIKSAQRSLQ